MANSPLGVSGLVAANDQNLSQEYVSDLLQAAPFINSLEAVPASNGTLHKYLKTTTAAGAGFRTPGSGRDQSSYAQTPVTVTLKLLDASFHVDRAIADAFHLGVDALMEISAKEAIKAALAKAEKQLIYGTGSLGDSDGFSGLVNNTAIDAASDTMVVNAGGSTANSMTSVYAVYSSPADTAVVVGKNAAGVMLDVGPRFETYMLDSSSLAYPAYSSVVHAWLGLQFGSVYSVGRICNIGASANKCTDALIAQLLAKFPVDKRPNLLVMSRQSLFQLQASRTATNATGAPAPIPTESFGVPIIATDAVVNTEAVVS